MATGQEFFQIEFYPTFTPIKSGHSKADIDFSHKRSVNSSEQKLLNHGLPITIEEIMLLQHRHEQGDSIKQLECFFQRSEKSIEYMIDTPLEEAI